MAVNLDKLIKEVMDMRPDIAYFIDKNTGEVTKISATPTPQELTSLKNKITSSKGNMIQMPRYPSKDNFRDMEEFIAVLKDIKLQKRLQDALNSGGAASKFFRDALNSHNMEKEKWQEYKIKKVKNFVLQFLKDAGIS